MFYIGEIKHTSSVDKAIAYARGLPSFVFAREKLVRVTSVRVYRKSIDIMMRTHSFLSEHERSLLQWILTRRCVFLPSLSISVMRTISYFPPDECLVEEIYK